MNILITGRPGTGKTTLIKDLIKKTDISKGGFYTEEIKRRGKRMGFYLKTLDGKEAILASVDVKSNFRVGRYRVDVATFEEVGVSSLKEAIKTKKLIVIDEIGKMELYSEEFKETVLAALNSEKLVLATIKMGEGEFIRRIKDRRDVKIFDLETKNYKAVLEDISEIIKEYQKSSPF